MLGIIFWEKIFLKNERKDLSECIRSAMLYVSETWCLRKNEMAILRRTEKAMMRAMCGVKLIEKRWSQISLLGLKDTLYELARTNGVRWHVLRRDNGDVLKERWIFKWRAEEGISD